MESFEGFKIVKKKIQRTKQHSTLYRRFLLSVKNWIVELDRQIHLNNTADEYDRKREMELENPGFKIIRFENRMVFDFLPSVLKDTKDYFK